MSEPSAGRGTDEGALAALRVLGPVVRADAVAAPAQMRSKLLRPGFFGLLWVCYSPVLAVGWRSSRGWEGEKRRSAVATDGSNGIRF